MTRNVQLAQVNHRYGGNKVWFPYSAGLIQANARAQNDLKEEYHFAMPIFMREDPARVTSEMDSPDVVGISSYIWNWEWSKALASEVKRQYPKSLVVMGGPQVPNWSDGFFENHPYVDIIVHGEGEVTFANILRERLRESPDYSNVRGITYNDGGTSRRTSPQPRSTERGVDQNGNPTPHLEEIVSPYLSGEFDGLLKRHPDLEFHVTSETHRGCPYSCDFCDWGSATYQHLEKFSDERVRAEYDWISNNKIEFVYNADANFIIFPRDEALTDYLIELNQRTGFPKQLRANWAKNVHERIFDTAKKLNKAQMDLGVTIALQSLNPDTLDAIHRRNIKHPAEMAKKYRDAGIPTYTEIIIPLPMETYETFTQGLELLLEREQHRGINIYQCMLLPNSEMSHPEYVKKYGIKSIDSPILQNHSTPGTDPVQERTIYAISTNTQSVDDFKRAFLFGWAVQAFHSLGLTQEIAIHLKNKGVSYREFYEGMLSEKPETIVGREAIETRKSLERILDNLDRGQWGKVDPKYGDIVWPFEEYSFLNIMTGDRERFYREVNEMVSRKFSISIPEEVITGQIARMRTPEEYGGDIKDYAKRVVWFGRKSGATFKDNRESVGIST